MIRTASSERRTGRPRTLKREASLLYTSPSLTVALAGLVLPAFCLLLFWGAAYALAAHLLGGGAVSWSGILGALRSAALGDVYFHLRVLYPLSLIHI